MAKAHLYIFYSHRYKVAKNGENKIFSQVPSPNIHFFSLQQGISILA
jgi:hypothetical protein